MKNVTRIFVILMVLILLPLATYFSFAIQSSGETVNIPESKVVYNLPYPGILSDHPLYFIKAGRDFLMDFLTRDNVKKAQLYLLYSDKRVAMSEALAKKGKNTQAISALSKAEKYFLMIAPLLKEAKKQGGTAPSGFIDTLKLANAKHAEVVTDLLKTLPVGLNSQLTAISKINLQIKHDLQGL